MGDLNYRITKEVPTDRVMVLSNKGELQELRENDQLNIERAQGRLFQGFEEVFLDLCRPTNINPGRICMNVARIRSSALRRGAIVCCG